MKLKPKIVKKPWGRELWLTVNKFYAFKILEITKGSRFSLQYHRYKTETWYIKKGKIKALYGKYNKKNLTKGLKTYTLKPGDVIHVPTYTTHRLTALTDCQIVEVSTPQVKDVIRLDDDYGRK
jgi:mannose-6-phosphate isomerase